MTTENDTAPGADSGDDSFAKLADPAYRQQMIESGMQGEPEPEEQEDIIDPVDEEGEPTPEPTEAPVDAGADDDDDEPTGPTVPKSRLDKEIAKRREAEKAALAAQMQAQMIEDAIKAYAAKKDEPEDGESAEFDPLDPETYALAKKTSEEVEKLKQAQDADRQTQAFASSLAAQEAEFIKTAPDFRDALSHVQSVEYKKLITLGATPEQAQKATTAYMHNMAKSIHEGGNNVAQAFYQMAEVLGYSKARPTASAKGPNLDKIAENKQKSASVNGLAGAAAPSGDGDDFKRFLNKHGKTDLDKLTAEIERIKRNPASY